MLDLLEGTLSEEARAELQQHLSGCKDCRELLEVTGEHELPSDDADVLPRGTAAGRYIILEQIGRGAMGVVYSAYDPELERKIAIKHVTAESRSRSAYERLSREGQALARLTHPNVVAIHDVGRLGNSRFLAMDLVEGITLRRWLLEKPRTWREILDVFLLAGRGLIAAHAAGVVHRDFKPENVLVGHGRDVRVTHFGLASHRGFTEPSTDGDGDGEESPAQNKQRAGLTRDGSMVGTPGYIAPEQRGGRIADARSDQFSFCVALFEAIYGHRPSEPAVPMPLPRPAPRWLRPLILRGLSASPEDRFPELGQMLDTIERRLRRPSARYMIAAGTVVACGVAALLTVGFRPSPCEDVPNALRAIWNPERREAVRVALTRSLPEGTNASAQNGVTHLLQALDAYASSWTAMATSSCEATRVHRSQSEMQFALRATCLERRRSDLAALLPLFGRGGTDAITRGYQLLDSLESLTPCADANELSLVQSRPDTPAARAAFAEIEAIRTRARAHFGDGAYKEGDELMGELEEKARKLGHAPTLADVLKLRAHFFQKLSRYPDAERAFEEASLFAEQGRDDLTKAEALIYLVELVSKDLGRPLEAEAWKRRASATLARLGNAQTEQLRAKLNAVDGSFAMTRGSYEEAVEKYSAAAKHYEGRGGEAPLQLGTLLNNIGTALYNLGRYDEALRTYQRGLELRVPLLGLKHPSLVINRTTVASALCATGRCEEAVTLLREVLAEQHSDSRNSRLTRHALGLVLIETDRTLEAIPLLEETRDGQLEVHGPNHPVVARLAGTLAAAYDSVGRHREALQAAERAAAIWAKQPDNPDKGAVLARLAKFKLEAGDTSGAKALLDPLTALRDRVGLQRIPRASFVLVSMARVELAQGRTPQALALADQALTLDETKQGVGTLELRRDYLKLFKAVAAHDAGKALALAERLQRIEQRTGDTVNLPRTSEMVSKLRVAHEAL